MSKIQKFLKSDLGIFTALFLVIIALFIFLSPKLSSELFPFKRQAIFDDFIKNTRINNRIDPQTYWKFREFYSPGYFTFSRTGISNSLAKQTNEKIAIKYNEKNISLTFLDFSSSRLNSLDMLTSQTDLSSIIDLKQISKTDIIFRNKNFAIYKTGPKNVKIVFLLSNAEMKKANGFFDYQDKDKKITEEKNWFNVTSLEID